MENANQTEFSIQEVIQSAINQYRAEGKTQKELAKFLGIKPGYLSDLKNGKRVGQRKALEIADKLGIKDISAFYGKGDAGHVFEIGKGVAFRCKTENLGIHEAIEDILIRDEGDARTALQVWIKGILMFKEHTEMLKEIRAIRKMMEEDRKTRKQDSGAVES
ncbi:MAG: helix-turn-helix transcriptional regulator [Dehalococcoidia bacterium]|jgi:transcriptional regulator with XRE-family HTH domain|nr:helix-turn-helix transcriptional regulator [Dehalococcoidia bacterium]